MKRFTEYLNEDFDPAIYNSDGGISIEDPSVVDAINSNLEVATACACRTPYNSLEEIRKVLAYYKIFLPKSIFLDQTDGNDVFEISQFGEKTGMNDQGEVVTANNSSLFVYFEWSVNERGMYDTFACVCDQEELDNILADFDSETGDDLNEQSMPDLKKKMGAKKVTLPNMMRKEETINEISKEKLEKYVKGAKADKDLAISDREHYKSNLKDPDKAWTKSIPHKDSQYKMAVDRNARAMKRSKGIKKAEKRLASEEAINEISHKLAKKAERKAAKKYYNAYDDEAASRKEVQNKKTPEAREAAAEAKEKRTKAAKRVIRFQQYADKKKKLEEAWYHTEPLEGGKHKIVAVVDKKNPYKHSVGDTISSGEHSSRQYASDGSAYSPAPVAKVKAKKKLEEANITNMQIAKAANRGDKALDKAYGYGTVKGGISPIAGNRKKQGFGAVANWKSAEAALSTPGNLRTKADAVHKGWGKTVDQMPAPEPKQSARKKLKNTPFFQLTRGEQEKDEVLAKAIRENNVDESYDIPALAAGTLAAVPLAVYGMKSGLIPKGVDRASNIASNLKNKLKNMISNKKAKKAKTEKK